MKAWICPLLAAGALAWPGLAGAQSLAAAYQQLLQPQLAQTATVEETRFSWDALHFNLHKGVLGLAAPVDGQTAVAVFHGQGELTVAPPNAIARQQMQFLLQKPSIDATFSEAVFRFGAGAHFLKALGAGAHFAPVAGDAALTAVEAERAKLIDDNGLRGVARQLLALDAAQPGTPGWFWAALKTDSGWVVARFDPLDSEAVEVSEYRQRAAFGTAVFQDVWAHFPAAARATAAPGTVAAAPPPDTLDDYHLQVNIPGNLDMQVQATWKVTAARPGRGLLLQLDPNLQVQAASLANGGAVEFAQARDPGHFPRPYYVGNWLYLRLPQALAAGQSVTVKLTYHGKYVIERVGPGNIFAQSSGWYPSNIFGPPFQRAHFDLQFTNDKKYTLVATGVLTKSQRTGDEEATEWTTPVPLTVAGFALGDYSRISKEVTLAGGQKVTVSVLSNNQPDDLLSSINIAAQPGMLPNLGANQTSGQMPLSLGTLNTKNLAPRALQQVAGALQLMSTYFGPFPYKSLSVVPIPGDYGQGWPGLLYLSDLSFLDSTQLDQLGIPKATMDQLSDTFRAHETSHQWWGHRVSWASYHDQWLSEGLANGSALLFQFAADGAKAGMTTLEQWRRDLEAKSRLGNVHSEDGPLWMGTRLASSMDPDGYQLITYDKGGYVLFMLRQMMRNPRSKTPDAAFIAMMHDFTSTYANRDASTEDFQRIVEKHMLPAMNVDDNGSMDWFFKTYVYGTAIPQLRFHYTMAADGAHTKISMAIDNPSQWHGLLPVYIWQGKRYVRGLVRLVGAHQTVNTEMPFKPDKIVANQYLDMLVDVDQ